MLGGRPAALAVIGIGGELAVDRACDRPTAEAARLRRWMRSGRAAVTTFHPG